MTRNTSTGFRRARWCVGAGIALAGAAMLTYPGGTLTDRSSPGYSQSKNYLSDLGMTVAYNGQSNRLGATIFAVGMLILVMGFGSLIVQLSRLYPERSKYWARAGSLAAVMACVGFAGVAITPENRMMSVHVTFTMWAWRLTALCPLLLAIASAKSDGFPRRLTVSWVTLTGVLFGYVALLALTHTVAVHDAQIVEVVAQKLVTATTASLLLLMSLDIESRAAPVSPS